MSIQENINKILWDRRYVTISDDIEAPEDLRYVIVKNLNLEDRNHYLFIRELEENKARLEGVPTEGEIMIDARSSGYWTNEDDEVEKKADDHIRYLEGEFKAKKKFKSRQNIIKLQIEDAKAKKQYVENKKNSLKQNTAEYLAHEIASLHLVQRCVFLPDGEKLVDNDDSLLYFKNNYPVLLFYLVCEIMSEGFLDVIEIREIARSAEWRLTWVLCRENIPSIFNCQVGDLTLNQKMLIYWSRIYDSAFESPEPPDQDIINNDELFDNWLASRDLKLKEDKKEDFHQERACFLDGEYIENCTCGAKQKNTGKGLGERLPHSENCSYGVWRQFTEEDKKQKAAVWYSRNSNAVRKIIDSEQETILRAGIIEEQNLRKDQKTRSMLGMQTKVKRK